MKRARTAPVREAVAELQHEGQHQAVAPRAGGKDGCLLGACIREDQGDMKRFGLIFVLTIGATEARAEEIYQDFRGKDVDERLFRLHGPDAALRIKVEPQGMRITMPPEPKTTTVGIAASAAAKGDFEITVGYEIIHAERPKKGGGIGLEMYLRTNTAPTQEAICFYRLTRPKEGEVYVCDKKTNVDGERKTTRNYFPTDSKSGRLLLARKGTEVTFSAAEGAGSPQELCRYEWGEWDVYPSVRAWGSHYPVDLRLNEIRIRDQTEPAPVVNAESPAPVPPVRRGWLLAGLFSALVLAGGGLWAWRRMAARGSASAGDSISFFCASCGKQLRTSAASAGKTIKCPGCGQSAPVPGTILPGSAAGAN
jgi:hypothetical protein